MLLSDRHLISQKLELFDLNSSQVLSMSLKFERALLICLVCILIWISLTDDAEGKGGRGGGRRGGYRGGGGGIVSGGTIAGFVVLVILSTCFGCCGCVGICLKITDIGDKRAKAKKEEAEKKIEKDSR